MPKTYGLIGSRADIGGALAEAQLASLLDPQADLASWGLGFFEKDEVLLRQGPGDSAKDLAAQIQKTRSHAFLAHACPAAFAPKSSESTPPLRYGHVLFSCQGVAHSVEPIVAAAKAQLPEFLHRTVKGETLSEVAFALFLSELPTLSLARTRLREPRRSVDPLQEGSLKNALRTSLQKLDALCEETGRPLFAGSIWIHTGELLMVAHRTGNLGLQVLRGAQDLRQWELKLQPPPTGIEQSIFVCVAGSADELGRTWERLPDHLLLTAERGKTPRTESL